MREISSNALLAFHSNEICRTFIPALSIRKLAVWTQREPENSVLREIRITILFRTGAGMRGFFESNAKTILCYKRNRGVFIHEHAPNRL